MSRRRNLWISLLSAMLSGVLVYGVYVLQLKQVELQETIYVVVPKDFIDAGVMITQDLIDTKPIVKASYDPRMFTDVQQVVGQETMIALGKGEPILNWKLNKFHLLPNRHQSTFQIPKEYILSISNGIRAGDRVRIYISSMHEEIASRKLFNEEVVVASVKSSSNTEVENPRNPTILSKINGDEEKMYLSRRDANAAIDHINLNLTEEQWLTIDQLCRDRMTKLVIAYASSFPMERLEHEMEEPS